MRRVQLGLWSAGLLLAWAAPGFAQAIIEPEGSGRSIPTNTAVGHFREKVFTTGDVSVFLMVFHGTTLKFSARAFVLTCGPSFIFASDVPLGRFGLAAGETVMFSISVRHHGGCDAGTISHRVSIIPVVAPCEPPPTTTTLAPNALKGDPLTHGRPRPASLPRRREEDPRTESA